MYSGSYNVSNINSQGPNALPGDWSDKIGQNYANRVTGSIKLNDGDNIQDASGHDRIKFTDTGATILYDEAGNAALTLNTDQSVALTAAKILKTDTINEVTTNGGVTVDGVLLKDNRIDMTGKLGFGGYKVTAGTDGLALTTAHVGIITIDTSAAKIDLTLPAVALSAGVWYKFILTGTGTESDIRTNSSENKMRGTIIFHTDNAAP